MPKRFMTEEKLNCEPCHCIDMPPDVRHHAIDVMRLREGQCIEVIDRCGQLVLASITRQDITKNKKGYFLMVEEIVSQNEYSSYYNYQSIAAIAVIKWSRFEWMLEKLAEIGIDTIIPIIFERCAFSPKVILQTWPKKQARFERILASAQRQSFSNRVELIQPLSLDDFLRYYNEISDNSSILSLLSTVNGQSFSTIMQTENSLICSITGPEGGLSPYEEQRCIDEGAKCISLGRSILRAETAPIVFWGAVRAYNVI